MVVDADSSGRWMDEWDLYLHHGWDDTTTAFAADIALDWGAPMYTVTCSRCGSGGTDVTRGYFGITSALHTVHVSHVDTTPMSGPARVDLIAPHHHHTLE